MKLDDCVNAVTRRKRVKLPHKRGSISPSAMMFGSGGAEFEQFSTFLSHKSVNIS